MVHAPQAMQANAAGNSYSVWQDNAGTTYYAPMGTLAFRLEIGADGVVQAAKLKGCDGQTVAQLRESGRAFFYR